MAHWISYPETERFRKNWSCSECGKEVLENPIFFNAENGRSLCFNFCPYCGVEMDINDGKPLVKKYNGIIPAYAGRVL